MNPSMRPNAICVAGIFAFVIVGCSGQRSEPGLTRVRGTILVDGQPARYATLTFLPVDDDVEKYRARGRANEDGEYEITTRRPGDGAKPGEYYVAVSWRIPQNPRSSDDPDYTNELLPDKFQDAQNSGLKVEITANESELKPIELQLN